MSTSSSEAVSKPFAKGNHSSLARCLTLVALRDESEGALGRHGLMLASLVALDLLRQSTPR